MKKGMTPLSATCLLIAFSILLGAIVMSWGRGYIEERAEFVMGVHASGAECVDMRVLLASVNNKNLACVKDNQLELFIENNGNVMLSALQLRVLGGNEVDTVENVLVNPVAVGDTVKVSHTFEAVKIPQQIRITPWLTLDPKEICFDQAQEYEGPFQAC